MIKIGDIVKVTGKAAFTRSLYGYSNTGIVTKIDKVNGYIIFHDGKNETGCHSQFLSVT